MSGEQNSVKVSVTLLMDGMTVNVARTKYGVAVGVEDENGTTVTMDTDEYRRLVGVGNRYEETLQRDWKVFTADRAKWNTERNALREQRLSLARKFIEANARAYSAERRVRELEERIEEMELDLRVESSRHTD